jgi:hypothetical protein
VVEAYHDFDSNVAEKLWYLLTVLKICLDCSWHNMELLLEQMKLSSTRPDDRECWDVDEYAFSALCSEAESNLLPLLEHRAATAAAHVGYFISRYASTLPWRSGEDELLQWREGIGPHVFADFVRRLDRDDFLNLLIADQCYRVWPGYEPVDVLRVRSDGEFRPVEGVLETKPFELPPSQRVLREVRRRSADGTCGREKGHQPAESSGSSGLPGFRVGETDPQRLAWPEPPWRRYLSGHPARWVAAVLDPAPTCRGTGKRLP